jgi:hypothetical protein
MRMKKETVSHLLNVMGKLYKLVLPTLRLVFIRQKIKKVTCYILRKEFVVVVREKHLPVVHP